ncbi:MAG: class I SAM-dependent methyltransferase [Halorhabdus sp.]
MDPSRADVRATYEHIGDHFSKTRAYAWPEVEGFVEERDEVDLALDVGCGNGRHLEVLQRRADRVLGLDVSRPLLDVATERVPAASLVLGDASTLPIRSGIVDLAIYVATLHHLPSREARVESLDELARVLAPAGRALVSAWSTAHERFDAPAEAEEGFDTTVDWTLPDGEIVPRFYHIYAPAEFRADVESSALTIETFEISSGNCYGTVRRS